MKKGIKDELSRRYMALSITAKEFANELTRHNVIEKDLNQQNAISKEHIDNHKAVWDILLQRGVRPATKPR